MTVASKIVCVRNALISTQSVPFVGALREPLSKTIMILIHNNKKKNASLCFITSFVPHLPLIAALILNNITGE